MRHLGLCREQDQPAGTLLLRRLERLPALISGKTYVPEIIETSAPKRPVRQVEAGGANNVNWHAKASGKTQHGSGVLRNIWLVECKAHGDFRVFPAG
jgi:hypothetical protein